MHLMLLTFGADLKVHYQANFAILTFLKEDPTVSTVNVFTDSPRLYQHLGDRVRTIPIDRSVLAEWEGPHRFFWRTKIKAIEALVERVGPEPVMYIDSDVFLATPLDDLAAQLACGTALMHENEGRLAEFKGRTTDRMWREVRGRAFAGVPVPERASIWNAGVVAVPGNGNASTVGLALEICDEMCAAGVTPRLIEQFALTLALDHAHGLGPASAWIGHYWGNKDEWNRSIAEFFIQSDLEGRSLEDKLQRVREFDYRRHPVRKRQRKSRERVRRLGEMLFPAGDPVYYGE